MEEKKKNIESLLEQEKNLINESIQEISFRKYYEKLKKDRLSKLKKVREDINDIYVIDRKCIADELNSFEKGEERVYSKGVDWSFAQKVFSLYNQNKDKLVILDCEQSNCQNDYFDCRDTHYKGNILKTYDTVLEPLRDLVPNIEDFKIICIRYPKMSYAGNSLGVNYSCTIKRN